jgi:hypothetical protein
MTENTVCCVRFVGLRLAQPQDGFRHYDAVADDTKIDGAERQQAGQDVGQIYHCECRHQGPTGWWMATAGRVARA